MDVDAPAEMAAQPVPIAEDEQANWEVEKAEYERTQFNLNQELSDVRERMEDVSRANGQMLEELSRHTGEIKEHVSRQRQLESARNDLSDKNIALECAISRLKIEKEEKDAAAVSATKEAQAALVETFALKDQLKQLTTEKAALAHSMEAFQHERQSIEFERQKYATERDLHAESKRWLMQEVAERDNRVSCLRLELGNKDLEGANERLQFEAKINLLTTQIDSLNAKVNMLTFNNSELIKRLENTELSKASEIANLEEEIRCQTELQNVMKNSVDEAKMAADLFKDQLDAQDNVLVEVRKVLQEHQDDMEREQAAHAEALRERDDELANTRAELAKVNEMIKSMSDVKLNVSEEELSELAPAAAETVRFLKGGQSLSGLVLEHARACGKLAESEAENLNLRTALEELIEAVNGNKPHYISQRRVADELFDKNNKFERQLDVAESERKELLSQRDSAQRDLAYVRAELEKYQRDYEFVSKRNAELMYAVERQSRMHDPNWTEQADEQLFQSIVQLQRRNVELESDIENAKTSAAQAAINAQSEEMAQLKADLAVTKKSEAELKTKVEQTKAAFDNLKEKTEHFKELVRDSVTASEARAARLKAEEAVAAKVVAEATVERLRAYAEEFKADYERREREMEQRIQNAEATSNIVNETNIKLNVMLEAQKTNTAAIEQEYKQALNEKDSALEELQKISFADSEKEKRLVDLGRQALEAAEQAGSLRVRVRSLEDELRNAKSEVTTLKMTTNSQRSVLEKEEQVRMSVVDMANFLSRVEAEKLSHANTQLGVLSLERDSLKASTARLNDQLTHLKNDAKLTQARLEKELEVARSRIVEKEQQISHDEMELVDLRSKLASVQGQFITSDAAGMTPDRLRREFMQLKTRTQFLESELDEAKRKLLEADAAQKRMDAEHAISASHNNVLEENLKQSEQMGAMEKERLIATSKCFEERAQQLTDRLAQSQLELNELKVKYDEASFNFEKETGELRRQLQVASLNIEETKRELEVSKSGEMNLRNEASRNAALLDGHNTIVRQFEDRLSENETARLRLQAELDNKTVALVAETNAKNEADQMREHVERQLQLKISERDALELDFQQKQADYETRLTQLSQQFEALSSNLTALPKDPNESSLGLNESSLEFAAQSSLVENLKSMLEYVRQTKDEAISRAMNAEVEMRRMRAETAEFERGKNELLQKIRDLETDKMAAMASLSDKAKLVKQIESLTAVHTINAKLTEEKTKLEAQVVQFQKNKADMEKNNAQLNAKIQEQNLKIAASNQEAVQRKREIDLLKQRTETNARGPVAAMQTQLEQLKTQLAAARQEAATASEQANAAEKAKIKAVEDNKAITAKFNQTRQLAIKYRDENQDLKKAAEGTGSSSEQVAPRMAAMQKAHADQVAQLNSQIEQLKAEIESLNVKTMRVNMLETRHKKLVDDMADMKEKNETLRKANEQLTQTRSVSATDVETKSATTSAPRPPALRQTPVKVSDPTTVTRPPAEPDQIVGQKSGLPSTSGSSPFGAKRASFGKQFGIQSSSNIVPPAPAPANVAQPRISPEKRPIPPSVPNEPLDIIPPVPSDNIPDPTPPTNTFGSSGSFGLPVPQTFQSSVRVPTQSLFSSSSTTTVQPQEKKNVLPNIDSAPSTPGSNVTVSQATSSLVPTQQLFGKSSAPPLNISTTTTTSTDTLVLPEESVVEGSAGQSSLVSGSVDQQKALDSDLVTNDGESRDSTTVGGVSSSDGRRKRTANDFELSEAKRQRESPNEAVTSSETRQQANLAEIPELDDDDNVLGLEQEVSDEDPNESTLREQQNDVIDLENDEEVLEDEMEEDVDDDEDSLGNDEEEFEEDREPAEHDVVDLSSDDDAPEDDIENDAESLNDVEEEDDVDEIIIDDNNDDIEEVLGGEDSQPSLDDQDREAASAVEEAEDEGRGPLGTIDEPSAPADPTGAAGIGSSGRVPLDAPRVRLPTGLREAEREDQCSSSNETTEERPAERLSARNAARLQRPMRGGPKPTRGVYMPSRGRGRGGGSGAV